MGIAGAVAAQELSGERETGVGGALVLGPVPVGKAEVGVTGGRSQLFLEQLQQLAVPRPKRRPAVGEIRSAGIVGPQHHHLVVGPDEVVVAALQRRAGPQHASGDVVGDVGDHVGAANQQARVGGFVLER